VIVRLETAFRADRCVVLTAAALAAEAQKQPRAPTRRRLTMTLFTVTR
jgi:hypothetical protein